MWSFQYQARPLTRQFAEQAKLGKQQYKSVS